MKNGLQQFVENSYSFKLKSQLLLLNDSMLSHLEFIWITCMSGNKGIYMHGFTQNLSFSPLGFHTMIDELCYGIWDFPTLIAWAHN